MSDCHNFAELSTEHIYALNLDSLNIDPATFPDHCLECLPRLVPVEGNSVHVPFVRVAHAMPLLT